MDKVSIARVVAALIALLALMGYDAPESLADSLVEVITAVVILWGIWKNNYIAKKGIEQKKVLERNNLK